MNFKTETKTQMEVVKTIMDNTGQICQRLETGDFLRLVIVKIKKQAGLSKATLEISSKTSYKVPLKALK
jgi:hypothetical protein